MRTGRAALPRGARRAGLVVVVLLACAARAHAQGCLEPSALDLDASAQALRVAKAAAGELDLSWQDTGAPLYHVFEGSIDAFDTPAQYDHVVVTDPAGPAIAWSASAGSRYFLVASECSYGTGSVGRDSVGRERPPGGHVLVTVGLLGGTGVFGVTIGVAHPTYAFVPDVTQDVTFLGPYAAGAAGDPLAFAGTQPPGVVTAAMTFQVFDPDPSFDPPSATPALSVVQMLFTFHGVTPMPADMPIVECDVRDALTEVVPGATCVVTGFDVRR